MAIRPAWCLSDGHVLEEFFNFDWNLGFAPSQKKKNVSNLHKAINTKSPGNVLEISTKSDIELGYNLSAFILKLNGICLENVFQSSKKYEHGGPYLDLITALPVYAKRDMRHQTSGDLISFVYESNEWKITPKTLFYDFIYIKAVFESIQLTQLNELKNYKWFTDIEFNPKVSINCQARTVAILKLIIENNLQYVMNDMDSWTAFHTNHVGGN